MSGVPRSAFNPHLASLDCPACGRAHDLSAPRSVCESCGRPLVARYDLGLLRGVLSRTDLPRAGTDLWRYRAVLPFAPEFPVTRLGEGGTPLLPLPRLAAEIGVAELWLKEESGNPTQSFKARGLALAVNGAVAFGKRAIALPSAGNAGSAAAAYASAAGLRCRITVPDDTPEAFLIEQRALGAEVKTVPGTISDAGRELASWAPAPEWWNVATFKEPFRLEGKKTLGYEIAEQCGWRLPEIILYPTGGGTAATVASGLRVPAPFADTLILEAMRGSGGTAVAVSEEELLDGMSALAMSEGCFACPEGGATIAALRQLRTSGEVTGKERVVVYNTGSGLKYLEAWQQAAARRRAPSLA